ncbi:uncharacterized protein ASCRUDRAFT_82647 [Ascoidea rubescens DSM 1968]|uniref:NADH-ubiquinone oxidoreductase 9.5 kDa subunit n=1 Tax=Ascoidea rubescens DSM 1968 TaxID=1344418 RepID=A0A1D2VAX7_9ASCO|nr:hypothetical protein ASCRUDRAFT_82647 [Ascoidea rubescens DSM 1968]ODV58745.1 hypothetical protein ASCRUDRAFT_82647 [Ascoidea rubescens DSM 1968]
MDERYIGEKPLFLRNPIRTLRFYAHTKPNLFFSAVIGIIGPLGVLFITPLRRKYLFEDAPPVPTYYPIPNRPRDLTLSGYDD